MPQSPDRFRGSAVGVAFAAAAYLAWGTFPLYFRQLAGVPAPEILAHRVVWSAVFVAALVTVLGRWRAVVQQLASLRTLAWLGATALFISANWLTYIWAVNSGHVLEASLGYFVNPLVTVLLGVLFLRDRLSRRQAIAVGLAATGVAALVVRAGHVPWIALALALTFGFYGLLRKQLRVDSIAGLLGEVALLAPAALLYLGWLQREGSGHFAGGGRHAALLAASGIVTALPLIWFAAGVQRLRLATVGLLQYLNPSLQFATAVFLFGERFTTGHAIAFGCIWVSLAIYTWEAVTLARRLER
jgi:chloramphenicol-sensitive protein RarD